MRNRIAVLFGVLLLGTVDTTFGQKEKLRTIIVMFDGLRPDYITPENMPRLYALSQQGGYGKNHRSIYPTVTRVNAASYATGTYPSVHGLMENTLYLPEIDSGKTINTGDAGNLQKLDQQLGGKLLTATSLGEVLQQAGEELYVYSSGTTGQAFLQNHKVNGAIINPDLILPENKKSGFLKNLGTPPELTYPNTARHTWITDALCKYTLQDNGPLVSAIWFSDPDGSAHSYGIGVPITMASIKSVDTQFGRILDSIAAKGLTEHFNIIVSADHGFVSYRPAKNLTDFLIEKGLKENKQSTDVVLAGSAIYVKNHDRKKIEQIVTLLQKEIWVGAIFTKALKRGSDKGFAKGTLSLDAMNWQHDRSGDIVVAQAWDDEVNAYGYAGTAYANGPAGHGGSSSYELHIALITAGPSFKKHFQSEIPTNNLDITPTILNIHQLPIPVTMTGRVLNEYFVDAPNIPYKPVTKTITTTTNGYTSIMEITQYQNRRYINYFTANRKSK